MQETIFMKHDTKVQPIRAVKKLFINI